MIYIWGFKAEIRKSKRRENSSKDFSFVSLLTFSLPLRHWDLFGYPSVLCQAQLKQIPFISVCALLLIPRQFFSKAHSSLTNLTLPGHLKTYPVYNK